MDVKGSSKKLKRESSTTQVVGMNLAEFETMLDDSIIFNTLKQMYEYDQIENEKRFNSITKDYQKQVNMLGASLAKSVEQLNSEMTFLRN